MSRVDVDNSSSISHDAIMLIAHDLKLPLATIKNIALDSDLDKNFAQEEYRTIADQANSALELISDLLEVYRLLQTSPQLALQPVSIKSELEFISNNFTLASSSDRLKIRGSNLKSGLAMADQKLLRRAISNLIDNSLRYSNPRSKVVARVIDGQSSISCLVSDHGPKLESVDLQALKGELTTSVSKRSAGSSGLGLYLTGRMVNAMNGQIEVQNLSNQNVFSISFPKIKQQSLF